jgi:biopolymer transport protein ExbD
MAAKLAGAAGGNRFDLGQNSDINVTPFVDVMLVLLIIFMVTAPLATLSIKLDLPPAQPPTPNQTKPKPPTLINIQQSGTIYVGTGDTTHPTTEATLVNDVKTELTNSKNDTVFIRADKHVKYSQFMSVVDDLQDAGLYKIALVTEDLSNET